MNRYRVFVLVLVAVAVFGFAAALQAQNVSGIYTDGTSFTSGGVDGDGYAYSATLLGPSQIWNGSTFNFGAANGLNAWSNTTITLTPGQYTTLNILGAAINGSQTSQNFVVTYADGSTASFTQSLSDWFAPQNYSGESQAIAMPYRDTSSGGKDSRTFYLYGYSFSISNTKTVKSLTLPGNRNVVVLAVAAAGADVNGIYSDGTSFPAGGGLDADGSAYSSNLLGSSQTWNGTTFFFGAANGANAYSSTTIPLTQGQYSTLNILGTAVNGNQASQTFVVTYTDGTTATFTQSMSDWFTPQSYTGESQVKTMAYRDTSSGGQDARTFYLYGYSFSLNTGKVVQSLTLPNNRNVVVIGAALGAAVAGNCGEDENGAGTGQVEYVQVYQSKYARWCVDTTYWSANQQYINQFLTYYDNAVPQLTALFAVQPTYPIVVEVTTPTGGACACGPKFGDAASVVITGDAYSDNFNNPQSGQAIPGFWGYLLTLHETINSYTGAISSGWPTDWWADHRSPFPNAMDEQVMKYVGTQQNNQTLVNAATAQHERFADPSQSGYDSEVAMFDNFFNQYGGFAAYSKFFRLVEEDKLSWPSVSQDSSYSGDNDYSALLSEYVAAYLSMAFGTTSDLTSTFASAGVGTLDTTEPAYTMQSSAVLGVANAHCSIEAASGAGVNVSTQLANLESGNYGSAVASGGTQSTCPNECSWNGSACVAKW